MSAGILLFAAKRAVIDTLTTALGDAVQVSYAFPANPERTLVYGGAARLTREQALAEWGAAVEETCVVDIWLRVTSPESDVRAAETQLETLAAAVINALASHTQIGTGLTFSDVTSATSPAPIIAPSPDPTIVASLSMQVSVRGVLL